MPFLIRSFVVIAALCAPVFAQPLPNPDDFAGFPIGSDGNLVRWERIVDYFRLLDEGSDRVAVEASTCRSE